MSLFQIIPECIKKNKLFIEIRERHLYDYFCKSFEEGSEKWYRHFLNPDFLISDNSECIYRNDYINESNKKLVELCRDNNGSGISDYYNSRYSKQHEFIDDDINNRMSMRIIETHIKNSFPRNSEILDVACGCGSIDKKLSKAGYDRVTVLDLNSKRIKDLEPYVYEVKCGDVNSLQSNEVYDVIIALEIFEHVSDIICTIKNIRNLMSENGRVYISTPNEHMIDDESHVRIFTIESLAKLMEQNGFDIDTIVLLPYLNHEYQNDIVCVCSKKKRENN